MSSGKIASLSRLNVELLRRRYGTLIKLIPLISGTDSRRSTGKRRLSAILSKPHQNKCINTLSACNFTNSSWLISNTVIFFCQWSLCILQPGVPAVNSTLQFKRWAQIINSQANVIINKKCESSHAHPVTSRKSIRSIKDCQVDSKIRIKFLKLGEVWLNLFLSTGIYSMFHNISRKCLYYFMSKHFDLNFRLTRGTKYICSV